MESSNSDYQNRESAVSSRILSSTGISRVKFDPANQEHLLSVKSFLETGRWGDVNFLVSQPFTNVPSMVQHMLCTYALEKFLNAK